MVEGLGGSITRVWPRLMKPEGLEGVSHRRKWCTTKRAKDVRPAPEALVAEIEARICGLRYLGWRKTAPSGGRSAGSL